MFAFCLENKCVLIFILKLTLMNEQDLALRLRSLELRSQRLAKMFRVSIVGWLLTSCVFMLSWTSPPEQEIASNAKQDTLRIRKLVILDEDNNERIVIAAPLPDPMVNGKVSPRRDVVTAIQFKDRNGTERDGIAVVADGSFVFGIDDEHGRERAHLFYLPKRGAGLFLQGENSSQTLSLEIPVNGVTPKLEMTDKTGKKLLTIPE